MEIGLSVALGIVIGFILATVMHGRIQQSVDSLHSKIDAIVAVVKK